MRRFPSDTDWFLFYLDLHGIMEGEALKKYEAGWPGFKLEQFCLV
jgi:hypothetical protein